MEANHSPPQSTVSTKLMRRQAYRGSHKAMFGLYVAFKNGVGCDTNEVAARFWLRRAAHRGHTRSMWVLSWNHGSGRCGFPKDWRRKWYWANQLIKRRRVIPARSRCSNGYPRWGQCWIE